MSTTDLSDRAILHMEIAKLNRDNALFREALQKIANYSGDVSGAAFMRTVAEAALLKVTHK